MSEKFGDGSEKSSEKSSVKSLNTELYEALAA